MQTQISNVWETGIIPMPILLYAAIQYEKKIKLNQLHTASRTQQGRQREPSDNTTRPLRRRRLCRRFVATPERRNESINVCKYFTSSSGDQTQNQSILQSHSVPLRHDWHLHNKHTV